MLPARTVSRVFSLIALLTSAQSANAADSLFANETRAAVRLYSDLEQIDTKSADVRLFGLQVERHGTQSKAIVLDASADGVIQTHEFACETTEGASFCQQLSTSQQTSYHRKGSLYAGDFLFASLVGITQSLEKMGISPDSISLFKVWQAEGEIQARIGFDASLVEVAFVCDPRAAIFCRPAESDLANEP